MKLSSGLQKRTLAVGAGAAALLVTLFILPSGTATAAPAQPSADTTGWVYYPLSVTLTNTTTYFVNGTLTDSGCQFSQSGDGDGSSAGVSEEVQIGENPATCTAEFESGTPTNFAGDTSPPSGSLTQSASASGLAAPGATAPSAVDPSIYQDEQWLDPFGIQVNAQEQWLSWTTGHCNISWNAKWKWSWLNDGWGVLWTDHRASNDCSRAVNRADSSFSNALFCNIVTGKGGAVTFTYFGWDNTTKSKVWDHLIGYDNGAWHWDYSDFANGGCSNLLHHGHIVKHS
jgi:hypothetical protein